MGPRPPTNVPILSSIALLNKWRPRLFSFLMSNRFVLLLVTVNLFRTPQRNSPFRPPDSLLLTESESLPQPPTTCRFGTPAALAKVKPWHLQSKKVASLVPVYPPNFLRKVTLTAPPTDACPAPLTELAFRQPRLKHPRPRVLLHETHP